MPGISAVGANIPMYRLARKAFADAWGTGGGAGERSVVNHDEDTMTMAVNAAVDLLKAAGRDGIDAVYFASTTPTYREKSSAVFIAAAADLPPQVRTADFGNTLRAGTQALVAALDAVNAGTAKSVLVVASDARNGYPRSDFEAAFGDAAAAVLVTKDAATEVLSRATISNEINDIWRRDSDDFVRSWEDRFIVQHGYEASTKAAVLAALKQANLKPADVTKVAMYGPEARSHAGLVRTLGFDPKQVQDPLLGSVGNVGAAHALLVLAAALEQAKPGDKVLVASYGDGADALVLEVKQPVKHARGVAGHLACKRLLPSYERFIAYRNVVTTNPEPPLRVEAWAGSTVSWRDQKQTIRLHASKCNQCGTTAHPIQRVCYNCRSKDDYTEVRLYDKPAQVYAFTRDNLAGGLEPPVLNCVIESDEGKARVFAILADADPAKVHIGQRVEFTFRKMHEAAYQHNYYWKARPADGQ